MVPFRKKPETWEELIDAIEKASREIVYANRNKIPDAMYRRDLQEAKDALLAKIAALEAKAGVP